MTSKLNWKEAICPKRLQSWAFTVREASGAWWVSGEFSALRLEGHRFKFHSNRHVGTLGKSFTRNCL